MFDLDKEIQEWRRRLRAAGLKNSEQLNELESHLREDVEQSIREGLGAREAFAAALERMGRAHELKTEFEKLSGFSAELQRKLKALFARINGPDPVPALASFNPDALQTLEFAREEAPRLNHAFIGTEHVLLGLLRSGPPVLKILEQAGVNHEVVRKEVLDFVGPGAKQLMAADIPLTPRAKNALAIAAREARALHQSRVGAEHILLGLLIEGDGVAARVLQRLGVQIDQTRKAVQSWRAEG